jgi:hypothetical protein
MRRFLLAAGVAVLLATSPAAGQDKADAARARGEEGLTLFKDGRWEDAYAAFAQADALFHAPTLVAYMGTCRRNQGRLVEAKALYEKVLAEPLPANATEAFKKARETARTELDKLRARIPFVKVAITGPGAASARVTVDGAPATVAGLAAGMAIDPGEHTIVASADGAEARLKIVAKEGDSTQHELKLTGTAAPLAPVAPPPAIDAPAKKGSLVPAAIAFGVGGAGIVAGAITGGLALAKLSAAREGCTAPDANGLRHCPAGNESAANAVGTLRTVSIIGFAAGGAGAITGVVLAVLRPGGGAEKAATIDVDVGPGSLGVRGRF